MSKRRFIWIIKVKGGLNKSDIKIKLVLSITSFCILCAYTIEAQISGERLQNTIGPLVLLSH